MEFKPFEKMFCRIEDEKKESDAAYFNVLMYAGEMLAKLAVAGLVAAVSEERDRHQYRLRYQLVRAASIGSWREVLDEIMSGVPAQYLSDAIRLEGRELPQLKARTKPDAWQYRSVSCLHSCLQIANPSAEAPPRRIAGKSWLSAFTQLRNSTRGHSAHGSATLTDMCDDLETSIRLFAHNFYLFKRPWVYLDQTLKGKYHLILLSEEAESLRFLATARGRQYNYSKGVYVLFGDLVSSESLRPIKLLHFQPDSDDYFLPNGGWTDKRYEMMSYLTSNKLEFDSKEYLSPVTELPPSETQGIEVADQQSKTTVNLPPRQSGYISRDEPEQALYRELIDDNQHRIISLLGRGGIGKTWLTIEVLDRIALEDQYDAILWFSSRDIDLLADGAKLVKPHILNERHIAMEFTRLIGPWLLSDDDLDEIDALEFLRENMISSEFGRILFVFDNFETVTSPIELFKFIDSNLRWPNRALITTRFREFNGDNPIELDGMSFIECKALMSATAKRLYISRLITEKVMTDLYNVSDGHPYIVKMLLAETKYSGASQNYETILARRDDMLDTLFERTYGRLSTVARRVFLTLCSWKSLVAESAMEAVLLRPENEMTDISEAIIDLHDSSLIEKSESGTDQETYWSVPLAARIFGLRKLEVDSMHMAIMNDRELLMSFGATQEAEVKRGIGSITRRLFRNLERTVFVEGKPIDDYVHIIEFVAKKHPDAWLPLADLYRKLGDFERFESTLKRCIEFANDENVAKRQAWLRLAKFYRSRNLGREELHARVMCAELPTTNYEEVSETANVFNRICSLQLFTFEEGEKRQTARRLIQLMLGKEQLSSQLNATDYSRLGWLYMHDEQAPKALESANRGLELDPSHEYCISVRNRALEALAEQPRTLI